MENVLDTIWVDFDYRISRGRGWNQENGKKFQSLLDWFTQLESKILLHFPSSEQKIEQVIDHLSPKIAAVAKEGMPNIPGSSMN